MKKNRILYDYFRIIFPVSVTLLIFIVSLFFIILPMYKNSIWDRKRETIRELTISAWNTLTYYHSLETENKLSLEEAQSAAISHIKIMRYGREMKDYFWINDKHPVMIMHPYLPELDGTNLSNYADPEGKLLFVEFVKTVSLQGEGYVEYMWQWQDDPGRIVPKISFVKLFEPWNWIIGTGMYVEDVKAEIGLMTRNMTALSVVSLFTISLLLIYIIMQNIKSDRQRREVDGALRKSELRFREMVELLPEIIYEMDSSGMLTFVNNQAFEMTGYSKTDLQNGLKGSDLLIESDRERAKKNIKRILSAISIGMTEYTALRKDGSTFPVLTRSMPIFNEGRVVGLRGIMIDISERLQLESQFHQAQKMESIGRLAGGIAHDFNNLLTVIMGNAELAIMLNSSDSSGVVEKELMEIKKTAARATNLTRKLLAFSRHQIIEPHIINLNNMLMEMDKMLRRLIGEDIELITLLAEELWPVKADPGQIEQIITNLVVNARDAMPNGGKLTIETENISINDDMMSYYADTIPGDYVLITVCDTGIGMDEATKAHIFEPFFTTKEKGRGTGLGLATCYGIVKQNNGNIYVTSRLNKGAKFTIYLPRTYGSGSDTTIIDKISDLPRGSETILLVEDDQSMRNMVSRILVNQGYRIIEASHGEEALRVIEKHSSDKINLMLTDVIMPQMGGKELAERVDELEKDIKVLFMSGYTNETIDTQGVLEPGIKFLQKPFTPEILIKKIREVLDS
ncbi:MAG: cache domain-containing protein [Candidatus Latescibacteria bacterium]|nr:cache domain-containing protein [Candidatus Latescibacterota bacterium]